MIHEKITHIDLFSGIGGFSLAADRVFGNVNHVFVEWDDFCQEVLKKQWPEAEYHKDIRQFVTDARGEKSRRVSHKSRPESSASRGPYILTGGFPCQPFSQAGRRQGTADDRYLWPPMLEAISIFQPKWVIAENVAGLVTWNNGLVLETVCSDLEREGYEVQPFVIPAVAVGAPHRRDRIWIVANRKDDRSGGGDSKKWGMEQRKLVKNKQKRHTSRDQSKGRSWLKTDWLEVASELCRVDDGLPRRLDRNSRLKALGNAIVPQVAEKIFKYINENQN